MEVILPPKYNGKYMLTTNFLSGTSIAQYFAIRNLGMDSKMLAELVEHIDENFHPFKIIIFDDRKAEDEEMIKE